MQNRPVCFHLGEEGVEPEQPAEVRDYSVCLAADSEPVRGLGSGGAGNTALCRYDRGLREGLKPRPWPHPSTRLLFQTLVFFRSVFVI